MKKTTILLYHSYLEDVIKKLHEKGLMEIASITSEEAESLGSLQSAQMHPEALLCQNYLNRLSNIITILKKADKKKKGLTSFLHPQLPEVQQIDNIYSDELYSDVESTLSKDEKVILKHDNRIQQINERLKQIHDYIEQINYLKSFDVTLSSLGISNKVVIKAGLTEDIKQLEDALSSKELIEIYSKQISKGKNPLWSVIIAGHMDERKTIERVFTEQLSELSIPHMNRNPKDAIHHLKIEEKNLIKEKEQIQDALHKQSQESLSFYLSLREQVQIEYVRKELPKNFARTETTYLIKGWILKEDVQKLKELVQKTSEDHAVITFEEPSSNPDNPPTYFKTPAWAGMFRSLLEMFGTPKYNEINPTMLMGIFFVIFFGIMLGDAGYGMTILILSLIGFLKFGKYSEFIYDWSFVGIWLGLTTSIVGFLTNSFFGNFVPLFIYGNDKAPLYDFTVGGIHFTPLVDSLTDPISILIVALIFGLLHLNVGIFLSLIQGLREKKYKELLTIRSCWIPLQLGGGILIGSSILNMSFSQPIMYAGIIFALIGFIQLLVHAGPIGFFDITGYIGDWLSYSRLLALGLATSGMALAFNIVAKLLGELIPFIGIIITIILLILAHIVNLILQSLGAGIHSLRLQYVEFFNRFYEGGGNTFSPFKIKRIYTEVKEDKNVD